MLLVKLMRPNLFMIDETETSVFLDRALGPMGMTIMMVMTETD